MARLLLVDDDPSVLSVTARILEGVGHFVLPVLSGALAATAFDLHGRGVGAVVVDVVRPDVDGVIAFWGIRQHRQDVPFLFVTDRTVRLPGRVRADPLVAHLTKPCRAADLVATVEKVLSLGPAPAPWTLPSELPGPAPSHAPPPGTGGARVQRGP